MHSEGNFQVKKEARMMKSRPRQLGVGAGALSFPPEPQVEEGAGEIPHRHRPCAKGFNQNFKVGHRALSAQNLSGR